MYGMGSLWASRHGFALHLRREAVRLPLVHWAGMDGMMDGMAGVTGTGPTAGNGAGDAGDAGDGSGKTSGLGRRRRSELSQTCARVFRLGLEQGLGWSGKALALASGPPRPQPASNPWAPNMAQLHQGLTCAAKCQRNHQEEAA